MRWLAGPVVWFTLIAFPALFAFGTYYCFNKYVQLKDDPSAQGGFKFTVELSYWTNLKDTWLALGIITVVFLAIVLLLIIFLAKRICLAIAIIAEASRALGSMIFTLFWPFVPFVLQVVLFAYWGASALFLASLSKGKFGNGTSTSILKPNESQQFTNVVDELTNLIPCDPSENGTAGSVCRFVKFGGDEYTVYLQFYMLFMLLWSANFIVALGQMTIAGAFASYFWAFNKPKDIPTFPVASSLGRALRYHLGTIAFGSLLVAIVQFIRIILEYLDHKLKASEYKIAKYLLKCLKCCFWCLEKFLKFFNTNAYIMTAIYGYNFCKAGGKAFSLILRNIIRVAVLDKVTDFLLFVGKLVVVGAVVVVSYFYFSGAWDEHIQKIPLIKELVLPDLNFYLIPIIIIGIGSFVIASGFFNVYSMGVDTLFLCFLEDLERHDGSAEKPYFMTKNLMKLLNKKNKKRKKDDE
jgi:choline transporter-like protein 2/4/5